MCRATTDITGYMYGYNISSKLVSKRQAHQAKLQGCLSLAANGQTLPKRQTGEGILQTVPWAVCVLLVGCSTGLSLVLIAFLFLKTPLALTVQCNC